jgi:hypothetical protein
LFKKHLAERRKIMGLKDFFVPKIAHSDPEVRKTAIAKETDQVLLQNVVKNDKDSGVVETAKKRLEQLTV